VRNFDTTGHALGTSLFVDDLPEPPGLLHATVVLSEVARGRLLSVDTAAAAGGAVRVLTAADIPGANQIGGIIADEPLLAEGEVRFRGQPVAVVLAESRRAAMAAAALVTVTIEPEEPELDPRRAAARGSLVAPSRTICCGDVDAAFAECAVVVEGTAETGGQEHLYLETQGALAVPLERGRVRVFSSTQAPTAVQRVAARVLGVPMNRVEVEVARLGGAFGGKEDQATPWAVIAALGARLTGRPVKLVLPRHDDLRATGKRHPYSSDYRLGLATDGRILACEVVYYQNSGAAADLSTAIMERSLLHATGSYFVPSARITGHCCRTDLPPFTAFRGFGAPQATFVIEAAIDRGARALGLDPAAVRRLNLLGDGDRLPCGMRIERSRAARTFDDAVERYGYRGLVEEARRFNAGSALVKRGVSVLPICFGISFTNTMLNQAGALVHVYTDGSVAVSTGAVEMGQGVNTKLLAVVAHTLGLPRELVTVENTNTGRVANTSPTAASSGADMNGAAAKLACERIRERLLEVAARVLDTPGAELSIRDGRVLRGGAFAGLKWPELVRAAYAARVGLSAQAHFATPGIGYDKARERGTPFAYHVWGAAISEVTLDCLRGTYTFDRVRVTHDAGRSLDELIDRGQVEGALLQGIGWLTMEEVLYGPDGRLLTDSLSTYKVPDLRSAPRVEVAFLEDADNPAAVLGSKAVGEPPLLYGIGTYLALIDAMRAYRPDRELDHVAPLTCERVLMFLHGGE
jgi:xanthine dehydrogenase large subunit